MVEIIKDQATILHFGCHAQEGKGFELYLQSIKTSQILNLINSWNAGARYRNRPDIRLILLNACEYDVHALELTVYLDFVSGTSAQSLTRMQFSSRSYFTILFSMGQHFFAVFIWPRGV